VSLRSMYPPLWTIRGTDITAELLT
jgi:hypothetical protein